MNVWILAIKASHPCCE